MAALMLAPVVAALCAHDRDFRTIVWSSGQQRELLDQALLAFQIAVDRDLFGVMQPDQSLAELTAALVTGFAVTIADMPPDRLLVQGDTTTAFAAALAAYCQRIPVAHVEAGLRSHDRFHPFPEEINRRYITAIADIHFTPTSAAADALRSEGVDTVAIHVTGNTIVGALMSVRSRLEAPDGFGLTSRVVRDLAAGSPIILVTCHRRENFGVNLAAILRAVRRIAIAHPAHRGLAELVGVGEDRIVARATELLAQFSSMTSSPSSNPFGDGRASERIADVLANIP
jgi:UDP-N-acetylglucosamine 2-epimerase (non-hydrolysing)